MRAVRLSLLAALVGAAAAALPAAAGTARPQAAAVRFAGNRPLPPAPGTGLSRNEDGEPGIATDGGGTIWVGSDIAPYAAHDPRTAQVLSGEDIWKSTDGGRTFRWVADPFATGGSNDPGPGGEDSDITAAPQRNAAGFYNVYATSLWIGSTSVAISQDGGRSWSLNPLGGVPAEDRPWIAADGPCVFYVAYHQLPTFDPMVNRYDVCDRTDVGLGSALNPVQATAITTAGSAPGLSNAFGKPAVDTSPRSPFDHRVYVPMMNCRFASPQDYVTYETGTSCPGRAQVTVAVSADGGRTFDDYVVATSPGGEIPVWPDTVAVDRAGVVYLAYSDNHGSYLVHSRDGGVHWSRPVRVNSGPWRTAVYPTVAAGAPGQVDVAWYGSNRSGDSNDVRVMGVPNTRRAASWWVGVAVSRDGGRTFEEYTATSRVHTGALCTEGDNCTTTNTRNLLDDFGAVIDSRTGELSVAYTSDQPQGEQSSAWTGYVTMLASPA